MARQHADKTIEKLIEYLTSDEGEVYLNDKEEILLRQIQMAHDLFQSHQFPTWKIGRMLAKHFDCSQETAYAAMRSAQVVFGARSIYNRAYMAGLHLDELIDDMTKARERQDFDMVLKLHAVKAKIIELLPANAPTRDITPAAINFYIYKNQVEAPKMPLQKALMTASKLLMIPAKNNDTDAD